MFTRIVLFCFGLSLGCGPSGARALALPSVQDYAVDRPEFHRRHHTEKMGPQQSAASPITTIKFVVDYIKLLFGDPTDMRMTRVSFFPPGSRAAVPGQPTYDISSESVNGRHLADEDTTSVGESQLAESSTWWMICLLYTSPSPRDKRQSRMPSSA